MIFDHLQNRARAGDQAEGLRQLRRIDAPHDGLPMPARMPASIPAIRILPWPRVVLISEFPGSDVGARFGFHLASALSQPNLSSDGSSARQNLLVDLAPAASRLPDVLADLVPVKGYQPLWNALAAGKPLAVAELNKRHHVSVAAESQTVPCAVDQLPRVYEQLIRALSRQPDRYRWIVMLGLDSVVPLDRACWQAADDVLLVGNHELSDCHRQAAAVRSRIDDTEPQRAVWTLPKRLSWLRGRQEALTSTRWLEAGIASKMLPLVSWPARCSAMSLREGSRVDGLLRRGARQVAERLRLAAACQDEEAMLKFDGSQKKIQLGLLGRTITGVPDEFRA